MTKFNMLALALTTLALTACGKGAVEEAVDGINLNPINTTDPTPAPTNPTRTLWTGTGTLKSTGMPESACSTVKAEIADDANGFELKQFAYECNGMSSEMDPIRLDLRSGDLYMGTNKVGQKTGNTVQFELRDSGAILGFKFVSNGTTMQAVHTMKASGFEQTLNANLHR